VLTGFGFGVDWGGCWCPVHEAADTVAHTCANVGKNGGAECALVRSHVKYRVAIVHDLDDTVEKSGYGVRGDGFDAVDARTVGSRATGREAFRDGREHGRFGDYLGHVGGLSVVILTSAVGLGGAGVDGKGRLGLDAMDAASGAHKAVLADGAVVANVEKEVADHTAVVVEEDTVASGFVSLAALLLAMAVLLAVQAVKMGVESVDFHNKNIQVCLGEEVVVVADSIGRGFMVSVLLLGAKAGSPLVASLGWRSAANEVRAIAWLMAFAFAATGFRGVEVGVLRSAVGRTGRRAANVLLLEAVALGQGVGRLERGRRGSGAICDKALLIFLLTASSTEGRTEGHGSA
jgi:hypothetical protein